MARPDAASRRIRATPDVVYAALVDPDGMGSSLDNLAALLEV